MAYAVSALIPCHDMAHCVARAVESVLAQEGPPVEVVVVDDGSQDDPATALRQFGDRVRLVRQANAGAAAARNTAARSATGEWLAFLDADDRWVPRKTLLSLDALARRPEARFVFGQALGRTDDGVEHTLGLPRRGLPMEGDVLLTVVEGGNPVPMSTGMVHREAFDAVDGLDSELRCGEDYDFWIRLAERFPAVYVAEPLVHYRMHRGGAVMGDHERWLESIARIHGGLLARHPGDAAVLRAVEAADADVRLQRGIDRLLIGDPQGAREDLLVAARHPATRATAERLLPRTWVPGWAYTGLRRALGRGATG